MLKKPSDKLSLPKICVLFLIISASWFLINLGVVYFFLNGEKVHRVETAAYIFAVAVILKIILGAGGTEWTETDFEPDDISRVLKIILLSAPILLFIFLYLPYFRTPFLSDDYVFIVKYSKSPFVFGEAEFFRPAFSSVFYILLKIFGANPLPFRLVNLFLHIGSSVLAYKIIARLSSSFLFSYIAVLFFFLNPLQAEAVLWISGMQETLWVFFLLLSVFVYTRKKDLKLRDIVFTSLFISLSLLSKETAVCFIAVMIMIDLLIFRFKRGKNLKHSYLLNGSILVLYLFIRFLFVSIPGEHLPQTNLYFWKNFLGRPFRSLLYPWNQAYCGVLPTIKFFAAFVFLALLFSYFITRKQKGVRWILSGLGLILLPLIPLTGMFYVAPDLQGSRYLYLSSLGWGLMISVLIYKFITHKTVRIFIWVFLILMLSFCLKKNLEPWGKAGEALNGLPADFMEKGAPDNYYGAYILRNGVKEYDLLREYTNHSKDGIFKGDNKN